MCLWHNINFCRGVKVKDRQWQILWQHFVEIVLIVNRNVRAKVQLLMCF